MWRGGNVFPVTPAGVATRTLFRSAWRGSVHTKEALFIRKWPRVFLGSVPIGPSKLRGAAKSGGSPRCVPVAQRNGTPTNSGGKGPIERLCGQRDSPINDRSGPSTPILPRPEPVSRPLEAQSKGGRASGNRVVRASKQ